MAPGAGVDAGDGAAGVRIDPPRRMVVAVVGGDPRTGLGAATSDQGHQADQQASEEPSKACPLVPVLVPDHGTPKHGWRRVTEGAGGGREDLADGRL